MGELLLVVAGGVVLTALFWDALTTTLAASSGGGFLTSRLSDQLWRVMLKFHVRDRHSSFLAGAGASTLVVTMLAWVALLWAGWSLVFVGSGVVQQSKTGAPADTVDVVYFTGMTIFTLGTGDYVAGTAAWRIVMAAASATGFFVMTLAITYVLAVVSADVARRSLAMQIHALGGTPEAIALRGWEGEQFSDMFQQQCINLLPELTRAAERHLAYPVLQHFHAHTKEASAPVAVANLDEALLLVTEAVAPQNRPDESAVIPLRRAIERYLTAATTTGWTPRAAAPPPPTTDGLAAAGVPLVATEQFAETVRGADDRRTQLHRVVLGEGWSWPTG